MPYDVEQALIFVIDQQPLVVRQGTRSQVWPHGGDQPWHLSLKRSMGSPASALVVVRELWHVRGVVHSEDLEGLVTVLAQGGSTTLHSSEQSDYLPRSTAPGVDGRLQSPMIPAAATVRWRGTPETRTRTVIVMTAGEGRWWRRAAPLGIPEAPDSSSSDEGLPDEDHEESASSSDNASSEEGWNSDSAAEEAADRDSREGFNLRVAALNVRGYGRKKTEVHATVTRYRMDALALTETRSRREGQVEGEDYDLWELAAERAEGKALLVHAGGHLTAIPEEVTEDVFVLLVQYRGKDLVRIGVVYATPDRPARQVLDGLREVISRTVPPLIPLGDPARLPRPSADVGVHDSPDQMDVHSERRWRARPRTVHAGLRHDSARGRGGTRSGTRAHPSPHRPQHGSGRYQGARDIPGGATGGAAPTSPNEAPTDGAGTVAEIPHGA